MDAAHNAALPVRSTTRFRRYYICTHKSHPTGGTFSVELTRFDAFKHRKSCTMFLVPEPEDEIVRLHSILLQHLPDYDDTARFAGGFHPHLSVGQFQHRSLRTEQQRLQTEWQPFRYEIVNLSLIYRSPERMIGSSLQNNSHFQTGD